jgi:hypothetical protein
LALRPLTDARAAWLGLAVAAVLVGAQIATAAGWSVSHDDPTNLELTARCFTREKLLRVEPTRDDPIASSASGGALTTVVEGNLVTVAIVSRASEAERLRQAYLALGGDVEPRLVVRGRYGRLWHRPPSPTQLEIANDCEY